MKITESLVFVVIISAVALQLGSGYSIGGIPREVPPSKVGDKCTAEAGCNGNTVCSSTDGDGFCTCEKGNHADDTFSCVSGPEVVGSPCKNGVGCEHLTNSECSSPDDKGTCKCSAGFQGDDGKTCTAVPPSKVGDKCTAGAGCNGNTVCSTTEGDGFCTCEEGNHADETFSCVSGPEVVGSSCKNGVGCEHLTNSECSSPDDKGTCKCSPGFQGDDGKTCTAVPPSKVGDKCTAGAGCNGNTVCSSTDGDGFCTCEEGNHADDTFSCASGDEKVNSVCKNGVGCEHLAYSECSTTSGPGTCQCSQGYSAEKDGKACVTGLNGTCKDNRNCKNPITETCQSTGNSTAVKTCQCKEGYKEANDMCKAPNSGICDEGGCQDPHAECVLPNTNSTVTSCICKAHYKLNKKDNTCIGAGSAISVAFGALVLSLMTILTH